MTGSGFAPPPTPAAPPYPVEKSSAPPPPRDGVDPFFGLGGGGGNVKKFKKDQKKLCALRANLQYQSVRAKMTIVYVKWYLYVKFNGFVVHDSAF